MAGLTPGHLLIILIIALVIIGPGKLPEVGSALGKSIREFQKAVGQVRDDAAPAPQPVAPVYPAGAQPPAQSFYAAPPVYGAGQYAPQPGYQPQAYAAPYPAGAVDAAWTAGGQPSSVAPAAPAPAALDPAAPPGTPSEQHRVD